MPFYTTGSSICIHGNSYADSLRRGLFDTALFGFREAPAHFRPKSYKDYVSAPSSVDIPDPVHTYPLLRPKANEGADKFLEWLVSRHGWRKYFLATQTNKATCHLGGRSL